MLYDGGLLRVRNKMFEGKKNNRNKPKNARTASVVGFRFVPAGLRRRGLGCWRGELTDYRRPAVAELAAPRLQRLEAALCDQRIRQRAAASLSICPVVCRGRSSSLKALHKLSLQTVPRLSTLVGTPRREGGRTGMYCVDRNMCKVTSTGNINREMSRQLWEWSDRTSTLSDGGADYRIYIQEAVDFPPVRRPSHSTSGSSLPLLTPLRLLPAC
jgi:hypothetical protein